MILAGKFRGTYNTCCARNALIVYASATWPWTALAGTGTHVPVPGKIPGKIPGKRTGHGSGGLHTII